MHNILEQKEIVLAKDEFLLLSYNEKVIPVNIEREKLEYCRTLVYWLNWTDRTKKFTVYNDIIERSLLVLKLMSFYNGAVLAAITTSLPETIGEVRNWDYRFCWLRDASMSIETLFQIGHVEAARRFMRFVQSTFVSQHDTYQIMYGIRRERKLTEVILGHLSGYKNSRPVRIGNDAYHQLQNDSFGYLMDLIYQYYRLMPGTLDEVEDMWEMVKSILTNVMIDWKKPDKGIWEIRGEGQHFVSSKVMCWVALDRGARIADLLNKPTYRRRWSEEATVIKENVMKNGWKEEMQSFSQTYGNSDLDASLLLMEPYGFIDPRDIRYHKTVQAIKNALLYKGLMYRYKSHDDFGLPSSAFTICTFWLIRALYVIGEKEEARSLFEEMLHNSNHLGLLGLRRSLSKSSCGKTLKVGDDDCQTVYFGYHPFKGDQNCYDEREKLRQWIDHNLPDHIRLFQPSGKENSNSSFPEDYAVKISDLQTVVSRLDKVVYKGKKYDKGSSLTDIYRKAIRLYGSYLMEMAKVVGSSQPADAQRQAMLDLDNYLFHSVKKMECTYVKENLLETRNNLLYPELAKLFKQLLSVKTISALRLQALQSDRKGYDDIDFFRDLYKGLFNGFDPQSAVSYEQMDIQLICLEAWLDIMQEATEHNSIKKRLTNELHSLHDRLEELSTTHSQREVRDMYILLLRRMDQYFRVVS